MPFTPFHMGPGLLLKAGMQGAFSLLLFGWTQVLIDIQPLVFLLTGLGDLHGWSHTFLGGIAIGGIAAATGYYMVWVAALLVDIDAGLRIRWWVALMSGFIDAVMHSDVAPLAPLTSANPFFGLVNVDWLHSICLYAGATGLIVYLGVLSWRALASR
jgi:hypothetical protein